MLTSIQINLETAAMREAQIARDAIQAHHVEHMTNACSGLLVMRFWRWTKSIRKGAVKTDSIKPARVSLR